MHDGEIRIDSAVQARYPRRAEGGFQVDLRQAIYALSDALDLVGIDEIGHGKRVGYMALQCGRKLGLDVHSLTDLFEIGLLHDCGVSSSRVHRHLVEDFDWRESQEHCQIGHDLLKDFAPLAHMALPILFHHTLNYQSNSRS